MVVVFANPLQGLDKAGADTVLQLQELGRLNPELLAVVLLLVREGLVSENRILVQILLSGDPLFDLLLEGAKQVVRVKA